MTTMLRTPPSMVLCLALVACASDSADTSPEDDDGAAGSSSGTTTGDGDDEGEDSGRDDDEAPPEPGEVTLHLYNLVNEAVEPDFSPIPATMSRVEMPPSATVTAQAPEGTGSVVFTLDGQTITDDAAPFTWSESAWEVGFGEHTIEATAHAEPGGRGVQLGEASATFSISAVGMDPEFEPLATFENVTWVAVNLADVMVAQEFASPTVEGDTLPYRLFTPPQYDPEPSYPLLVYLHGRGERGYDNRESVYGNSRLFTGPQSIVSPNFQAQFPSFVLVPQCGDMPGHQEWAHWIGNSEDDEFAGLGADGSYRQHEDPFPSARMLLELVQALQEEFSIDPRRIYLVGESMGGFGTWDMTSRWPDVFAAGVPMAGYSDRSTVDRIVDIPFWVFHGDADQSNPVVGSRAMVDALTEAGATVRYTEYAQTGHVETFSRAWETETELLDWIYAQRQPE